MQQDMPKGQIAALIAVAVLVIGAIGYSVKNRSGGAKLTEEKVEASKRQVEQDYRTIRPKQGGGPPSGGSGYMRGKMSGKPGYPGR